MHTLLDEIQLVRSFPSPSEAKALRLRARISRRRLADELKVDVATLWRWEEGRSEPRGRSLIDYARLLAELQQVVA